MPVNWLKSNRSRIEFDEETLLSWIVVDVKKPDINVDDCQFCDQKLLTEILSLINDEETMPVELLDDCRKRSNPYESIKKSIFVSRAGVKLANIDYECEQMFSKPFGPNRTHGRYKPQIALNEIMYVADIGGGPGGFVDYMLWRNGWQTKCFGITPQTKDSEYKPFYFASEPNSFQVYYAPQSKYDPTDPQTIDAFIQYVHIQTEMRGVHVAMADSALPIHMRKTKEILSKHLHLCNSLVGLSVLREHGHFVMKLFDTFTPFTVGLLYLLRACFQQTTILKPRACRPDSGERYFVGKWKMANSAVIVNHLCELNKTIIALNDDENLDITELVSRDVLLADQHFSRFICQSNDEITTSRIAAIRNMRIYYENTDRIDETQAENRVECLRQWNLPEDLSPTIDVPIDIYFEYILGASWTNEAKRFMKSPTVNWSTETDFKTTLQVPDHWFFVPIHDKSVGTPTFFLSKGKFEVYAYRADNETWEKVADIGLTLPSKTLIFGEIVVGNLMDSGKEIRCLHIIDGLLLGGVDVRDKPYSYRTERCQTFAMACNNPTKVFRKACGKIAPTTRIVAVPRYRLMELGSWLHNLSKTYVTIHRKKRYGLLVKQFVGGQYVCVPNGLMMFDGRSTVQAVDGVQNTIVSMMEARQLWRWSNFMNVIFKSDRNRDDESVLVRENLQNYLYK